jgi:hypothetical protein
MESVRHAVGSKCQVCARSFNVLASVPAAAAAAVIVTPPVQFYRLSMERSNRMSSIDIRLQGDNETVFFDL